MEEKNKKKTFWQKHKITIIVVSSIVVLLIGLLIYNLYIEDSSLDPKLSYIINCLQAEKGCKYVSDKCVLKSDPSRLCYT